MKHLTKYRTLMGFIYALIMLLPFSGIALRCLYVTFNKNAFQSYSDTTSVETSLNYQSVIGNEYIINWVDNTTGQTNNTTVILKYNDINVTAPNGSVAFRYGNNARLTFFDSTNTQLGYLDNIKTFTYTANDTTTLAPQPWFNRQLVIRTFGKLDNAFDYSLYTFLNENGVGRLNLTNWFVDTFLDETSHNMLYINYVNWYMNYSLLISCVYLLYLVLMWFITLARRLLTSFDERSY